MNKFVVINKDGVYSNALADKIMSKVENGPKTILQLFMTKVNECGNSDFLGTIINKQTIYKTFNEVNEDVLKLAGYLERKIQGELNPIIGIYSVNRPEWIISEFASYYINCVNVPLFSNFSNDALKIIFEETEMNILIASGSKARSLYESEILEKSKIKHIVLMDEDEDLFNKLVSKGYSVDNYNSIIKGELIPIQSPEPIGTDLATICYTSGTSGNPKGVELTHENIVSSVLSFTYNEDYDLYPNLSDDFTYISYLPLPHVLERVCFLISMFSKAKICFFSGNPKNLQEDLKIIKPKFIVTVPRVLNVFAEKIKENIAKRNIFVRLLFKIGVKWKIFKQKFGFYNSFLFDRLIFNKVAQEFGGELKMSLCGGAPLNPEIQEFIQATMCIKIFQGYGQTEGFGANFVMPFYSNNVDSIGVPFPTCRIKLNPVEDFKNSKNNTGEILFKGKSFTRGYYKRPEETKKLFDKDGWLKSGDVAMEKNGFFYIIGRVKDIFKTSFGEYIVPEKVELAFTGLNFIQDIFVTVTKYSNFLVAIVVSTNKNITESDVTQKCKNFAKKLLEEKKLKKYEIPDRFIIIRKNFIDLENSENLITPSLKKKRNALAKYFEKEITKVYSK